MAAKGGGDAAAVVGGKRFRTAHRSRCNPHERANAPFRSGAAVVAVAIRRRTITARVGARLRAQAARRCRVAATVAVSGGGGDGGERRRRRCRRAAAAAVLEEEVAARGPAGTEAAKA